MTEQPPAAKPRRRRRGRSPLVTAKAPPPSAEEIEARQHFVEAYRLVLTRSGSARPELVERAESLQRLAALYFRAELQRIPVSVEQWALLTRRAQGLLTLIASQSPAASGPAPAAPAAPSVDAGAPSDSARAARQRFLDRRAWMTARVADTPPAVARSFAAFERVCNAYFVEDPAAETNGTVFTAEQWDYLSNWVAHLCARAGLAPPFAWGDARSSSVAAPPQHWPTTGIDLPKPPRRKKAAPPAEDGSAPE